MKRGSKQRAGRANLRKREKRNGLVDAKNRGWGGPTLGKKKKTNG